jgi:hypothetical protein
MLRPARAALDSVASPMPRPSDRINQMIIDGLLQDQLEDRERIRTIQSERNAYRECLIAAVHLVHRLLLELEWQSRRIGEQRDALRELRLSRQDITARPRVLLETPLPGDGPWVQ